MPCVKDVGREIMPATGTVPTEQEKLTKPTSHVKTGEIYVGDKKTTIEITSETTPNAKGGYDTVVKLPVCTLGTELKER